MEDFVKKAGEVCGMITRERAESIVTEQYDSLLNFCSASLRNEQDAADVVQETLLFFLEKAETLNDINIKSWLFSVANFKIKEYYYKDKISTRFISYDENHEPVINIDYDGEEYVDDEKIKEYKMRVLAKLSPKERELFIQVYEKKRKYAEVAKFFDISQNAVSTRTYRLRKKINQMVELGEFVFLAIWVKLKCI